MFEVTIHNAQAGSAALPYALYRPPQHGAPGSWPLVVFLHGAGERGDDGVRQTTVGLGPALEQYPGRYPGVILLPQCSAASHWRRELDRLLPLIDAVTAAERIDPLRVYVTGISMGGYAAFALAALHPDRFAAVVPICGWGDARVMPARLRSLPMWIFHGAADDIVPVEHSRQMVHALERAGATSVRYTEYPSLAHNSWDATYADPSLPKWLFAQRRVGRSLA